jgi:beta-lactamase regulating signal transducer with metallopeptidase domain
MIDTALLNSLWQGALVTAIAAVTAAFLPRHHAASRYTVWLTALAGLVAVPLITAFHPPYAATIVPTVVAQTNAATTDVTQRAADAGGPWLTILWALGALFCIGRLLLSHARIAAVVRESRPAPGLGHDVRISDSLAVPIAAGFVKPVVILPAAAVRDLPSADLRAIIEHERAHIRRGDLFTNLLQRLVEAALFFNPWAYVIGRQLVNEREAACDDWAVVATGAADRYAAYLAELALAARGTRTPLLTPSALGSKRLLLGRITRLLTGKAIVVKANYLAAAASVAAVVLLTLVLQSKGFASNCYRGVTVISAAAPDIPKSEYRANATANALVTVGVDGHPVSAKIVLSSGSKAIDNATIVAAMKSTYSPEVSNCKRKMDTYLFKVETAP